MKKKFLTFMFVINLILPCVFILTACGGKKEYCEVSQDGTSCVSFDGTMGGIEKGKSSTYDIYIEDCYDLGTLKIFANGSEISWAMKSDYVNDGIVQRLQELVGTVTLSNITDNIELSATCEFKKINVSLTIKEGATNIDVLNDFKVYGKTETLLESVQNSTVFETPYNQISETNQVLRIECDKHIGYYEFYDEMTDGTTTIKGVIETDGYRLASNPSVVGWKSYSILTNVINYSGNLPENISIEIDPDDLTINSELTIDNGAGSIVTFSRNKFASNDIESTITIADISGANYENAVLKINGNVVIEQGEMVTRKTYQITSLPILYGRDYEDVYMITLEGLDLSEVAGLYSTTYIDNGAGAAFSPWFNSYYTDENIKYFEATEPTTNTILIYDWNSEVETITISSTEGEITIDLSNDVVDGVFSKNGYSGTFNRSSGTPTIEITNCPFTNDVHYTFEINKQM